jgi:DNA-binding response OmpR family regulator
MKRIEQIRQALSELSRAQMTAASCVSQLQELVAIDDAGPTPHRSDQPRADETTFCVVWRKRQCYLGHTKRFHLFARLLRRTNQFVSYDHLLRDVWHGDVKSPQTVRSAVRELRRCLVRAKMQRLAAAIRSEGRHYGLIL